FEVSPPGRSAAGFRVPMRGRVFRCTPNFVILLRCQPWPHRRPAMDTRRGIEVAAIANARPRGGRGSQAAEVLARRVPARRRSTPEPLILAYIPPPPLALCSVLPE